jgi:uncharacterized membrane protein YkgB
MSRIVQLSRVSIFIIYFWFGFLKIIGVSPAEGLVNHLFDITLSGFISFKLFFILFGLIECVIGLVWLFPNHTKIALYVLIAHLTLTVVPIFALPRDTWADILTPTLVGQYIIKNLVLLSTALLIYNWNLKKD